jgi:nucleotide-binding universal stress UspA family protein
MPNRPIIIAYDGSPNADDAAVLGRLLAAGSGAPLALAHVYRAPEPAVRRRATTMDGRERFMRQRAADLLARGAELAGRDAARVALASTTTATGMRALAEREQAALLVFGSAYDTQPGRVHPGSAARRLLQVLPCAIAFAPVGYREHAPSELRTIALAGEDAAARTSAQALARATAARVTEAGDQDEPREPDDRLLFLGSAPSTNSTRVIVNADAGQRIQRARSPVVVVPHDQPLELAAASHTVAA